MRELAPQVLGALVRRYGQFDVCEDATQLALLAASQQWSESGLPDNPRGWLLTVASRRMIDEVRSASARRERENAHFAEFSDSPEVSGADDTLTLLFMCCHPSLTAPSQLALTLRAVGGLTTAEIANAFMVPEATMAQRISRAKANIAKSEIDFTMPQASERSSRLNVVMHVLYLIFNEGYTASSGSSLLRTDLTKEALRLARLLAQIVPDNGEVLGLQALMLLTEARRNARQTSDGFLIPLEEQNRALWDASMISQGTSLVAEAMRLQLIGPYQIQAAIAALHDEAATADATDWPQIAALYAVLERIAPSAVVTLNRAVSIAHVDGPQVGLDIVDTLDSASLGHRFDAVRGHLLEQLGHADEARECYLRAARVTNNRAEQRYLMDRGARL